jgi:sporulation protein YlmC with PRC-barrel domain
MSYTKEKLVGMRVYDAKAMYLGTVKDIALTVGQETLSFLVGKEKEAGTTIAWKDVQAVGEIIILKAPEPKQQAQTYACPSCGQPLTWIEQYQRWYCTKEKKYA